MNRKGTVAFILSIVLPLVAFVVVGMRLFGNMRWIIASPLYIAGVLLLVYAVLAHRRARQLIDEHKGRLASILKGNIRFIFAFLATALLVYLAVVLFPAGKTEFNIDSDWAALPVYLKGLDDSFSAIEKEKRLFTGNPAEMTPEDKTLLVQLWSRYLAYSMQLEQLKHVHKHFFQINYLRYPELNLKSFLIAYSAFVAGYQDSLRLVNLVGDNAFAKTFLNERRDRDDVPAGAYLALSRAVTDPNNIVRLNAGRANLEFLKSSGKLASAGAQPLISRCEEGYSAIVTALGKQPSLFAGAQKDTLEKLTLTAWLPLQKGVAEGMSLIRTTHRENLVKLQDVLSAMKELEPGDILLERRNWYLTNIGIPGFWPHTALYTGTLKEMDEYFRNEKLPDGLTVSEYVRKTFPALHARLSSRTAQGHEFRTYEAIGPGVVPTAFEVSGRADYLAALRPRLSRAEKLQALLRAFSFYARPYDYNFDFATDNELVCSELIYKTYQPSEDSKGLNLKLKEVAGRLLLPPNNIVEKFDFEFGADDAGLDFVFFLDGSEKQAKAARKDVESFRASYKRPKWDIAQE